MIKQPGEIWFLVFITDTRGETAKISQDRERRRDLGRATWQIEAKVRKVITNYSDLFSIIMENQVELTK